MADIEQLGQHFENSYFILYFLSCRLPLLDVLCTLKAAGNIYYLLIFFDPVL